MKQIDDNSYESARKKFLFSLVILVIALMYLISPVDLIPGPPPFEWVEDIPILIISVIYSGYSYMKLKKEKEKEIP